MLELREISKTFPGVRALHDVSLQFKPGEIHALLGENGAGKSTLIKIVCGIYRPDDGFVLLDGQELKFHDFNDALNKGVSLVNQEIQVIPESSIAENIMLDKMVTKGKTDIIDWKAINRIAQKYMDMVELRLPPTTKAMYLSAAQKQLIAIAKALSANAKILLLDEPTSSLTEHETENLFRLLNKIKENNVIMIFVSHKLEEAFELCDSVSVLRDGKHVGTKDTNTLTKQEVIKMMIGRETQNEFLGQLDIATDQKVLEVKDLCKIGKINNASFSLYKGEILGFYGLVGSGRTELAKLIIGEDEPDSGDIFINGGKAHITSPADSLYRHNLGYVTENRKEEGLILDSPVKTNVCITIWNQFIHKFSRYISSKQEADACQKMIRAMSIRTTGLNQLTRNLSGGNQQKVSISKWLAAGCDILIVDEPTVGVDIGAKEAIHKLIWNLAKVDKKSIILISSDMPEMINLARRILVFREKEIVGEIDDLHTREFTYDEVSHRIGHFLA